MKSLASRRVPRSWARGWAANVVKALAIATLVA